MNRFLKFLFIAQSVNVFADHLLIPIFALFILGIGGNAQIAGFLWALQFATSALVGIFVLRLRDQKNLDLFLLKANYILKGLAWSLLLVNQSVPTLIATQILIGFASAIGGPSFNALTSEHLDKGQHIHEWGVLQLVVNGVIAASSLLGGFILIRYGFTPMFMLMAILEFLSFILLIFCKPRKSTIGLLL